MPVPNVCAVTDLSFVRVQPGQMRIDRPLMPSAANKWIIENPVVKPPVLCLRWDTRPSEHSNDTAADWFCARVLFARSSDGKMNLFLDFHSVSHTIYIFIFLFRDALTAVSSALRRPGFSHLCICIFFFFLPRTSAVWVFVIFSLRQTRELFGMLRGMKFRPQEKRLFSLTWPENNLTLKQPHWMLR